MPTMKSPLDIDTLKQAVAYANMGGVMQPAKGAVIEAAAFVALPKALPTEFSPAEGDVTALAVEVSIPGVADHVFAYIPIEIVRTAMTNLGQDVLYDGAIGAEKPLTQLRVVGDRIDQLSIEVDSRSDLIDVLIGRSQS